MFRKNTIIIDFCVIWCFILDTFCISFFKMKHYNFYLYFLYLNYKNFILIYIGGSHLHTQTSKNPFLWGRGLTGWFFQNQTITFEVYLFMNFIDLCKNLIFILGSTILIVFIFCTIYVVIIFFEVCD